MGFCRERRYSRAYLWTSASLDAARHLHEEAGFRLDIVVRGNLARFGQNLALSVDDARIAIPASGAASTCSALP